MIEGVLPSHTLLFMAVYCMYNIFIVFALMSVFDLSPPHPRGMDTRSISSPDLWEEALDDMMHSIHLQGEDQDIIDHESEQD